MPQTDFTLPGEAAVVTGAGAGIGREIASRLTEAGVDVAINDLDEIALSDTADSLAENDGDLITLVGDASDPDAAQRLVETAVEEFGGLQIVVNNIGIAGPTKPCEDIATGEFLETLEINLGAMFATARAAIPHLREGKNGRIVNLSSMSGKRPLRDRTPYTTAKMGVIGFTRTLATELASDDVTVNAICPGSVEGERLDAVIEGQAKSQGRLVDEVEQEFKEVSPMEQFVQAGDVANTVLFLCSEQAERMTGQDLNVTAGIVMY
jgi:NAD(P)-dependent dehydrogenase (short-subunit alcohol dehydrogenase family)